VTSLQKALFFGLALCSLACLAAASVTMAMNRAGLAIALFVVAFLLIGFGFAARKRVMKK